MVYMLSGYFTEIFLYLCLIYYYCTSYSNISAYATSSNSSEEIKKIFSLSEANDSEFKGVLKTGNFAEGGPIIENLTQSSIKTSNKNSIKNLNSLKSISGSSNSSKRQNISSIYTNLLPTKLIDSESNLFLGMPEVIHSNGTSSVKPRKGVVNEKEGSLSFSENQTCLWLNENECYIASEIKDLGCFCCKEGNELGKEIKQQASVNCKNCISDSVLPSENKQTCKNICCNSVTTTNDSYNNYLNYSTLPIAEKKQYNSLTSQISGTISENNIIKGKNTEKENSFSISKKNSKLKPSITKVPYDVEVVTEVLSKGQQKIFVPVVVLLFLLPLIGILIFFLWQRVKDYWDKRYYKRTDFLIDGMYND